MSDQRRKPEHEHRRNPLTVRWTDQEHRLVVDEAWKRRISASELVRRFVLESLARRES